MDLRLEPLPRADASSARAEAAKAALPFLQSAFWSDFKAGFGWRSLGFRLSCDLGRGPREESELRVMLRSLAGPLCFAYLPGGPALDPGPELRAELLARLGRALRPHLPPLCLFLRFDPPWYEVEELGAEEEEGEAGSTASGPVSRPLLADPLRKAGTDVQPPDTVLLELGPSEEELLAGMKAKWRYNIRLAAKKGVSVADEGRAAVPLFYRLYEETARRDRIAIHPLAYYERLFDLAAGAGSTSAAPEGEGPRPDLHLWVARHEGEALAAIITLHFGDTATYLYGASSDEKRSLMPTYALQWAAIRAAKAAGCRHYDFYGIPPREDPKHPMAGLYRFKTGFGGRVLHYAGSWDLPLRSLAYGAWIGAEALRALWFKKLKKRLGRGSS